MPIFFSETFSQSASSSFGVVNRQRMFSCARRSVRPCSTTCCLYASAVARLAHLEELDDPARVEVDDEADAAAVLREVLDGETQAARPRRPEHEPVRALREKFVGQRVAEHLVVGAEVVDVDARLGHAGAAARLEDVDGTVGQTLRHPAADGAAAQPLVLEGPKRVEVVVGLNLVGAGRSPESSRARARRGSPSPGRSATRRLRAPTRRARRASL